MKNDDTRSKILRTIIDAKKPLSLSVIAKRMRLVPQKVAYHLEFLEEGGLIIREGNEYFCQPILIDIELRSFCAEKIVEIIESFSKHDGSVVVVNGQSKDDVILNTLYALIDIVLP
jgi:predicted transcriptional regulator